MNGSKSQCREFRCEGSSVGAPGHRGILFGQLHTVQAAFTAHGVPWDKFFIEDDYEDKVNVYKVNVNFDAELAEKYAVMASPTILFFKGGEEVSRIRGLVKRNALEEEVGKLL